MPRVARAVAIGVAHHVTQRGNNRQKVFFADADREHYLLTMSEQSMRFSLTVRGYCLMDNHVHLVVVPYRKESLAQAVGTTHLKYTQYLHKRLKRSGHLWQNRFYSCPLDSTHELAAIRYVERNPVRAGMVRLAWKYPWSSAAAHVGLDRSHKLLDLQSWRKRYTPAEWKRILQDIEDEAEVESIRHATINGFALGRRAFVKKLEAKFRRALQSRPRGRPRVHPSRKRK